MSNIPLPGQIYRHFKGNLYRIVTLAEHSETGEKLVIYQALYSDYAVYARPLSMFMEKLDKEKYPDAASEYRFELQRELIEVPLSKGVGEKSDLTVQKTGVEGLQGTDKVTAQTPEKSPEEDKSMTSSPEAEQEELNIDPLVLEFLDAGSYEERLNILSALHHRITDDMINTMAMAVDLEIGEGDTEERFEELRTCLLTFEKYECNRLR